MKKLFLLCACLLALSVPPVLAAGDPDIILVRVYDIAGPRIVITRGEGKSETIEFKGGNSAEGMKTAGDGYYKVLSGIYKEGYTLQSTFSSAGGAVTTLLFVKVPKP